jgi:hypothetical protein
LAADLQASIKVEVAAAIPRKRPVLRNALFSMLNKNRWLKNKMTQRK